MGTFRAPNIGQTAQPKRFALSILGEGGWLKALRSEDYALRRKQPGSLQQALFPYHEAWD